MIHTDLTLKERMKSLQAERDYRLDKDSYILCHIDGRAFSKMIKRKFKLPFDDDFMHMFVRMYKVLNLHMYNQMR